MFKRRLYNVLSNVTLSPRHRQAGAPVIRRKYPVQPTLRNAPNLCENVSLTVLFGSNDNSYTTPTQSDMRVHTHILYNTEKLLGRKK
jgi:hypothetical protein